MTRPRDFRVGDYRQVLLWHKQKWRCRTEWCEGKVFTEAEGDAPIVCQVAVS